MLSQPRVVTPEALLAALRPLGAPFADGALIAVSGGPDSMALLGLAAALDGKAGPLFAATVDHGLRAGAGAEAEAVAAFCAARGIPHAVLTWRGEKPVTRIQERARAARYRLLCRHAAELGLARVLTAHTLDDQAETLLFRMARGSGPAGLAGMAAATRREGVALLRPLLDVPKADLVATCTAHGWSFAADPSNTDVRFARARLRRLMPALAAEGLDAARLAVLARRLREDEAALESLAAGLCAAGRRPAQEGTLALDAGFLGQPSAVARRALQRLLAEAGSPAVRLDRLERATARLQAAFSGGTELALTLAGLILRLDGAGDGALLAIRREGPRRRGRNLERTLPAPQLGNPPWGP